MQMNKPIRVSDTPYAIDVESGKKYLASQGLEINKANLSRLFGNINFFSKYQYLPLKAIDE